MRKSLSLPLTLGLSLTFVGPIACGDDSDADPAEDEVGDGDGDPGDGDGDPGDGDGDPGDGDGDPGDGDGDPGDGDGDPGDGDGDGDPGDGDGDPGDGDGDPGDGDGDPGDCQVWEITYDLTDSEFEISDTPFGAGDQVNVVMEPYDDDEHVGPGSFVLRFQDVDGAPGGQAFMYSHDMTINFVVASATTVTTDLQIDAGPEDCGITSGAVEGTTLEWMPSAIVGAHSMGTILCEGVLCGAGGLPDGEPVPVDESNDQPLSPFEFNDDLSGFTMAQTVVQEDDNSTTTWMYVGTETSRELVAAPACLCE